MKLLNCSIDILCQLFPVLAITHIVCLQSPKAEKNHKHCQCLKKMLHHKHLDPQENNFFREYKGMSLPLSRGKSMSSDCNCSLSLTVDARSEREGGFLHPTCSHRVRTHNSVIYHHATSTCQLDNDFSLRVSKLEMLFRLQKQLHVFCFLSQRRPSSMQMKGILNLPGLQPQHSSALLAHREHTPMERELVRGEAAHGEML